MSDLTPRTRAYVRLSREDLAKPGSLEEKFETRAQICHDLAARYGLTLSDSDIAYELKSGTKLSARPAMLKILEEARTRRFHILLSAYQDRVLRGDKRDEQDIEDTFIRARIRLITTEGEIDFGDEDYDPTLWEWRAMAGRAEVRRYSKRRRETHKANARLGKRDQGFAPYGYVWIPTQIDPYTREVTSKGHYEVISEEYSVLEELFRRAWRESVYSIVRDMNTRYRSGGSPAPPGIRRRPNAAASLWRPSTVERILKNPFYAGFPAQRSRIIHGERRWLSESEWVMPDSEQAYAHPISLSQHYQIRRILGERTRPGVPNTNSDWPLTGILRCGKGRPMHAGSHSSYQCSCRQLGEPHPGMYISKTAVESLAIAAITAAVKAYRPRPSAQVISRDDAESRYRDARQDLNRAQQRLSDLEENFGMLFRAWGQEKYEESYASAKSELESAQSHLSSLEAEVGEPEPQTARVLVEFVRQQGVESLWAVANPSGRRDLAASFLGSITLESPKREREWVRWCRVETLIWLKPFYAGGRLRVQRKPGTL